jgi:hypothetical protein
LRSFFGVAVHGEFAVGSDVGLSETFFWRKALAENGETKVVITAD